MTNQQTPVKEVTNLLDSLVEKYKKDRAEGKISKVKQANISKGINSLIHTVEGKLQQAR